MNTIKNKRSKLLVIILILAALTVFSGCQPITPGKQEAQPQSTPKPTVAAPQPKEQAPEDLKGFTEYKIREQLGKKTNDGRDRIKNVGVEGSEVIIELNGNNAFSADMTVRGMLMDSRKLLESLSMREDVNAVSISEYLEVEDIGGGTVPEWVFTLRVDNEGLEKVAEGDFLLNDLPKLAKEYKIHPNFNKE